MRRLEIRQRGDFSGSIPDRCNDGGFSADEKNARCKETFETILSNSQKDQKAYEELKSAKVKKVID